MVTVTVRALVDLGLTSEHYSLLGVIVKYPAPEESGLRNKDDRSVLQ